MKRGKPARPESFWRELASAHDAATAEGRSETVAVGEYLATQGINSRTSNWIYAARRQGFIAPTAPGVAPSRASRMRAVAAELGVTEDALRQAIAKHGGRVTA